MPSAALAPGSVIFETTERAALIALNRVPRVGAAKVRSLLRAFGSLDEAARAAPAAIAERCKDIGPALADEAVAALRSDFAAREEARAEAANVRILTWDDDLYPDSLRAIPSPPLCLYCAGEARLLRQTQVAIVGTRRPTVYATEQAGRFALGLASAAIHVTSGLAEGVDAAAHRGALDAGPDAPGKTIAVVGTALDCLYPEGNKPLARDIARAGGLVVSEYPFGRHGDAKTFPQRNRIVAAIAKATLVIEAGARSGTLITASFAHDFGRVVYAIPGRVDSPAFVGNHALIRNGEARLVTRPADILEEFGELDLREGRTPTAETEDREACPIGLSGEERRLWEALGAGECSLDVLSERAELPLPAVSALVIGLQMRRLVRPLPGGLLRRA